MEEEMDQRTMDPMWVRSERESPVMPVREERGEERRAFRARAGVAQDWLARGLGVFSIGLGIAQIAVPRRLARLIGVPESPTLFRLLGAREIATGVGILMSRKPTAGIWARAAGDGMDLGLLISALRSERSDPTRVMLAMAAVGGVTALDVQTGQMLSGQRRTLFNLMRGYRPIHVRKSVRVNCPPEQAYRFWHDFQNLPRFIRHLESVQLLEGRRSRWIAKGPAGTSVEWEAEVTEDRRNEKIAWKSLENAEVENRGYVLFEPGPGGRGTTVFTEIEYVPPAGALGAWVAKLFGEEPGQQVSDDLRRFKQVMETGEVLLSEANLSSMPRPAQPPE
jgi:uncharacterized membrane protein